MISRRRLSFFVSKFPDRSTNAMQGGPLCKLVLPVLLASDRRDHEHVIIVSYPRLCPRD